MKTNSLLLALAAACTPAFATIQFVSTPFADNDMVLWSQLGADQAAIPQNFNATSTGALAISGVFTGAGGGTVLVIPGSWPATPGEFDNGDSLIWTGDSGGGLNGPLTISFPGVIEAGLWLQNDVAEQFTGQIQVFEGASSQTFTTNSDVSGDPVFLGGLEDTNAPLITKLIFSITACATCNTADFAVDTLFLNNPAAVSGVPEPSSLLLFGAGLVVAGWRFRMTRKAGRNL